ncbi:putative iron/ascorbate oxidoreductase [Lachnellula suecica]|uniref:Putative iron/ascorbate oxidoreductase n=1 Tax=Lachnellula suecica TaxID=602035 RepID=A0A8T9CAR5_9HELO|nr:putative iron/ascorbate oxidoreductase [Lachnellula suecica]
MSTSFSSLPIVSLSVLSSPSSTPEELIDLSSRLDGVFSTTGCAYLTDLPLTYSHEDVFGLCDQFFGEDGISKDEKMRLAKKTFVKENKNTYRGYFPAQPGADNLKEGFELGTPTTQRSDSSSLANAKFNLAEPNVFPSSLPSFQSRCETLHTELQTLSARLLSLLAVALRKPPSFFHNYLANSLSTLRLLHYPSVPATRQQELICTPHTDSGILTLLHQDKTGGLEVRNSDGEWIPAPYVPGSVVVNIGDLMAKVSGGRWVATYHRVRSTKCEGDVTKARYSVPFFFEPGLNCVVKSVGGEEMVYGEHVLEKMKGWVEFQDVAVDVPSLAASERRAVEAF